MCTDKKMTCTDYITHTIKLMLNICCSAAVVRDGGSQAAGTGYADVSEYPPAARGCNCSFTAMCYCTESAAREQPTPTQYHSTVQYITGIHTQIATYS